MKFLLDKNFVILQTFFALFAFPSALLPIFDSINVTAELHKQMLVVAVGTVLDAAARNVHDNFLVRHTFIAGDYLQELFVLRVHLWYILFCLRFIHEKLNGFFQRWQLAKVLLFKIV